MPKLKNTIWYVRLLLIATAWFGFSLLPAQATTSTVAGFSLQGSDGGSVAVKSITLNQSASAPSSSASISGVILPVNSLSLSPQSDNNQYESVTLGSGGKSATVSATALVVTTVPQNGVIVLSAPVVETKQPSAESAEKKIPDAAFNVPANEPASPLAKTASSPASAVVSLPVVSEPVAQPDTAPRAAKPALAKAIKKVAPPKKERAKTVLVSPQIIPVAASANVTPVKAILPSVVAPIAITPATRISFFQKIKIFFFGK